MAKKEAAPKRAEMNPVERLGLRVSAMIQAPRSQAERRVVIHKLDTDPAEAWCAVLDLLREEDGIAVVMGEDDSVTVSWSPQCDWGSQEREPSEPVEEPAPF